MGNLHCRSSKKSNSSDILGIPLNDSSFSKLSMNWLAKYALETVFNLVIAEKSSKTFKVGELYHVWSVSQFEVSLTGVSIKFEIGSQFEKSRRRY